MNISTSKYNANSTIEGHTVAYQCKGLNQGNIVCEYEVNPFTNDKDITEIQNFNAK